MVTIAKISSSLRAVFAKVKRYSEAAVSFRAPHQISSYIAVTIDGMTWRSQEQAMRAAESCFWATNLPTYIVSSHCLTRFPECTTPAHLKLWLFDIFPEAETIVYFSNNIFFREKIDLLKYENTPNIMYARTSPSRRSLCDMILYRIPFNAYFTTDLFIISRKSHEMLLAKSRALDGPEDGRCFDEEILLNRAKVALSLSANCFSQITPYPMDSHYHAPLQDTRIIRLETVPTTCRSSDELFYAEISPAFGTGKLGRMDRRHLARSILSLD